MPWKQTVTWSRPLLGTRLAPPRCLIRQTSFRGICARNSG